MMGASPEELLALQKGLIAVAGHTLAKQAVAQFQFVLKF